MNEALYRPTGNKLEVFFMYGNLFSSMVYIYAELHFHFPMRFCDLKI